MHDGGDMEKELMDLFVLVKEMRATRKDYFRTRDANTLDKAWDLERKVDEALKNIEKLLQEGHSSERRPDGC